MGKIALQVTYDGTAYHGFQLQANAPTIQGELEKALARLTAQKIRLRAASRTDAGVHAEGQVVAFSAPSSLSPSAFMAGLNAFLPPDIRVTDAARVREDFDPRREAVSREYRYLIDNRPVPSPLHRRYACWVASPLCLGKMQAAAGLLEGRQDFAPFSGPPGRRSTVRTVYRVELRKEGPLIAFHIVADSFLPQQVRRMVGSLVQVGRGKMSLADFQALVRSGTLGGAGPVLPPAGLCLVRVNYREPIFGGKDEDL